MKPKPQVLFLLFLIALTVFRLALIGQIPLTPDEAYYWSWSRVPAVCYYDQPGMVAWVHILFSPLFPQPSPFSVRFPGVVLATLTTWILYRAYRLFHHDETEAAAAAIVSACLPIFFLGGLTMLHDNALFFFLALAIYLALRLLTEPSALTWYLLGISFTAAMYSKFSAILPAACFGAFALHSKSLRPWLRTPHPWLAGLISAALFLPAILWNYQHGWISVQAVQDLTRAGELSWATRVGYFFDFLGSQLAAYTPLLWITLIAACGLAVRRNLQRHDEKILLLAMLSVPILLYFFVQSFRSHVYGNWSAIAYPPALMLATRVVFSYGALSFPAPWIFRRGWLAAGLAMALAGNLALVLHVRYRTFAPAFRWVESRLDSSRRLDWRLNEELVGWPELADAVADNLQEGDFLLAHRYQIASALEFYVPGHPHVKSYSRGRRGSQFDLWTDPTALNGRSGLYVDTRPIPEELAEACRSLEPLARPLKIREGDKVLRRFNIYRCAGLDAAVFR